MRGIAVLLAEEQLLVREAMLSALEREAGIHVTGVAGSGHEAVAQADVSPPDVAIVSESLEKGRTVHVVSGLRRVAPRCGVLILTDRDDAERTIPLLEAGAGGYVTRGVGLEDLMRAIRSIHDGEMFIPARSLGILIASLLQRRRDRDDSLDLVSRLTRRERQVLVLLAHGCSSNEEIARRLVISPETARTHIQNVLSKLQVHSRLSAAALAIRDGIHEEMETDVRVPRRREQESRGWNQEKPFNESSVDTVA